MSFFARTETFKDLPDENQGFDSNLNGNLATGSQGRLISIFRQAKKLICLRLVD